jgi:hypothetical protein
MRIPSFTLLASLWTPTSKESWIAWPSDAKKKFQIICAPVDTEHETFFSKILKCFFVHRRICSGWIMVKSQNKYFRSGKMSEARWKLMLYAGLPKKLEANWESGRSWGVEWIQADFIQEKRWLFLTAADNTLHSNWWKCTQFIRWKMGVGPKLQCMI